MLYLTVKALHLIAMVAWYAGLFYLPRLYVYHAECTDDISHQRFITMERRLYRGIMTPSMIATLIFGTALLALNPAWLSMGWVHAKLALIVLLIGYHHVCLAHLKRFARGENQKSSTYFRWFNEVPLIPLVLIVFLAVLRPF